MSEAITHSDPKTDILEWGANTYATPTDLLRITVALPSDRARSSIIIRVGEKSDTSAPIYCSTVTGFDQSRDPIAAHSNCWEITGRDTCLRYLSDLSEKTNTAEKQEEIELTKHIVTEMDCCIKLKKLMDQPPTAVVSGQNGKPAVVPHADSFATWSYQSTESSTGRPKKSGVPKAFKTKRSWKLNEKRRAWEPESWEMRFQDPIRDQPPFCWETVWRGNGKGLTQTTEHFRPNEDGDVVPWEILTFQRAQSPGSQKSGRASASRKGAAELERPIGQKAITLHYPTEDKHDWKKFMRAKGALLELGIDPSTQVIKSHQQNTDVMRKSFVDERFIVSSVLGGRRHYHLNFRNPSYKSWVPTTAEQEEEEDEGWDWIEANELTV